MFVIAKPVAVLCALLTLANVAQAADTPVPRPRAESVATAARAASDVDHACLSEAIYFEAGTTPDARAAVAHVILNRAKDPQFPKTVCGVVRDGCQFSYRCSGRSLALKDAKKRDGAQRTAAAVLTGEPDITNGALFFHSARADAGWFASRRRVGEIGGNVFYR